MSDMAEVPPDTDLRIEREEGDTGVKKLTITAFSAQAEIDLETEYPRIVKLLERDWAIEQGDE